MQKYKGIDLFCGIGGFRLAMKSNNVKCVFSSDAENGGYPPTQNGDIRSLFWLFSLMALQN